MFTLKSLTELIPFSFSISKASRPLSRLQSTCGRSIKLTCPGITVLLLSVCLFSLPRSIYAQGTVVWSADMQIVDYFNGAIGAPLASLFTDQGGSQGLQAIRLWYYAPSRVLNLAFTTGVNTEDLTLHAGDLVIAFPEGGSGDSSWSWDDADPPGWTDGETIQARLVRGGSSDSADATDTPVPPTDTPTPTNTPVPPTDTPTSTDTPVLTATATPTSTPTGVEVDRAALVALYNATDGDNWTNNSNWLSTEQIGNWHGVTTGVDDRVESLILWNNNLNGTLPVEIGNLAKLTMLDLQVSLLDELPSTPTN